MRNKQYAFILFLLIITTEIAFGKDNKTKVQKAHQKKQTHLKDKFNVDRLKRSLNEDEDRPFWANRGRRHIENPYHVSRYDNDLEKNEKTLINRDNLDEEPFWGARGRRDSSSAENYIKVEYPENANNHKIYYGTYNLYCKNCHSQKQDDFHYGKIKNSEAVTPFWGNRGRRNSDEIDESASDPFWGNRGRRHESSEEEPFWGNRGRRDDVEPFWGNRGRRGESEPFWGNRGRRLESEPFWGNRGRREESEPFWGNRGRRKETEELRENRRKQKQIIKESIMDAIKNMESDIEKLSRLRRSGSSQISFWGNRGRDSKLKNLFKDPARTKMPLLPQTVHDSRIYAEEPNYIVVERNSRSSAEDDPFYITRGKKYYLNYNFFKAARDRRGAIEEIVKSVRNDPYYIARGKKDLNNAKIGNTTVKEEFVKARDLICAAIDMLAVKNITDKVKRDIIDNDRDRRTILKKIAAQLQNDPYFVSRGKRDTAANEDYLRDFINDVAGKC